MAKKTQDKATIISSRYNASFLDIDEEDKELLKNKSSSYILGWNKAKRNKVKNKPKET